MSSAPPMADHPAPADPDAPAAGRVLRPFQYMGAKLRALDPIREAAARHRRPDGVAFDLFTGSTVVAQALAADGHRVAASDALHFAAATARAVLGEGREAPLAPRLDDLLEGARALLTSHPLAEDVLTEADALAAGDGESLLRQGARLPQVWRPKGARPALARMLDATTRAVGAPMKADTPLLSTHHAGTYFGVRQAIALDGLRLALDATALSPWQRDAALTALTAALSAAAFTPGKHFAQPHRIRSDKDLAFHRTRVLKDRGVDVLAVFAETVHALDALPTRAEHGHTGRCVPFETLATESPPAPVAFLYADPPYTAQQYARFYHIPETLAVGRVPRLQVHRGRITSGLYGVGRFASRFCSKRDAPAAFEDLFDLATRWQAPLLLSYAGSASGRTGNDRMVDLEHLRERLRARGFRDVDVVSMHHDYRQLNQGARAVQGRDDHEFLLLANPPC